MHVPQRQNIMHITKRLATLQTPSSDCWWFSVSVKNTWAYKHPPTAHFPTEKIEIHKMWHWINPHTHEIMLKHVWSRSIYLTWTSLVIQWSKHVWNNYTEKFSSVISYQPSVVLWTVNKCQFFNQPCYFFPPVQCVLCSPYGDRHMYGDTIICRIL